MSTVTAVYTSSSVAGVAGNVAGITVAQPASVASGGLYVAFCWTYATSNWTPSDGTFISAGTATNGMQVFYRLTTSSETSTYTFTRSNVTNVGGVILAYLAPGTFDPITPIAASSLSAGAGGSITIASVTATHTQTLLLQFVGTRATATTVWTAPATATEVAFGTAAGTAIPYAIGDETVSNGASGTRIWTHTTNGTTSGSMVAINPGTVTPPPPTYTSYMNVGGISTGVASWINRNGTATSVSRTTKRT